MKRARVEHWEGCKPPLSTFPRPRNLQLKGFLTLTQWFCMTQFLRNFSFTNLSNFSLNPWKFSRTSHGKESDNLNLCCVKKQLSPSSAHLLLLTLTAVVFHVSFSLLSQAWHLWCHSCHPKRKQLCLWHLLLSTETLQLCSAPWPSRHLCSS